LKKPKLSHPDLVRPYSMETHLEFSLRFGHSKAMIGLFPDIRQRTEIREQIWRARWVEATVTVTRLDGTQFFID